jgi:3-methylfumaryl-CoA hydratase
VSFDYKNQVFPDMQTPVPPGWHSAYFPDRSPESQLGADGYESDFHPPDPFTGRLWAGAKMDWNHLNRLKVGDQAVMYSFLEKAELKKSRLGESAMVWSVKDIYNQDGWAMRERRCLVFLPEQKEPNIATKEIKGK